MKTWTCYLCMSIFLVFLSCTKVDELSDDAEIVSFRITGVSEGVQLDQSNITVKNNEVLIPVEFGRKNFPLTIATEIGFSKTTDETKSVDARPLNLREFTFPDVYTSQKFYLIAASGKPHLAQIRLVDKLNAEILGFDVNLPDKDATVVRLRDNQVRIILKKSLGWPLTITPKIRKTPTARYRDYQEGDSFTFTSLADNEKHITLEADNGDERTWKILIVPSIENSDFERWINEGTKQVNIDPVPGEGLGWATANNSFVCGTRPVAHGNGKAAEMTTELQSIGFLGDLVTSATLFTGKFKINISALNNPAAMTHFGIPFVSKPQSVTVEAAYTAGKQLQQSVKNKNGIYELTNLTGVDTGRIWVKVLHWAGEGELKYHDWPVEGVTVLGEGEQLFDGSNTALRQWGTYTIPIKYDPLYQHLGATHFVMVMTSSRRGDFFIGAVGSKLTVDNVQINY